MSFLLLRQLPDRRRELRDLGLHHFLMVKQINRLKRNEPVPPSATPEDIQLLREIRDSLKK